MTELLSNIETILTYIKSNTENEYIIKVCGIIDLKLDAFRNKEYTTHELVNQVCDKIINYDIRNMKGVSGQADTVYEKMNELSSLIEQIKIVYFEET